MTVPKETVHVPNIRRQVGKEAETSFPVATTGEVKERSVKTGLPVQA